MNTDAEDRRTRVARRSHREDRLGRIDGGGLRGRGVPKTPAGATAFLADRSQPRGWWLSAAVDLATEFAMQILSIAREPATGRARAMTKNRNGPTSRA